VHNLLERELATEPQEAGHEKIYPVQLRNVDWGSMLHLIGGKMGMERRVLLAIGWERMRLMAMVPK